MTYQSLIMRSASAAAIGAVLGSAAFAAPEAGSVIGNQAVATYTNSAGDTITVTSNTVETIVQQVAGVTLTSDNSETIAPGGKAFLPHIITNEGNGSDSFLLSAIEDNSGTLDTTQLVFYPDANMDGVADSATPLTSTPVLAPGEQFGVVIEATCPMCRDRRAGPTPQRRWMTTTPRRLSMALTDPAKTSLGIMTMVRPSTSTSLRSVRAGPVV